MLPTPLLFQGLLRPWPAHGSSCNSGERGGQGSLPHMDSLFFILPLRMDLNYLSQPEEAQKTMHYSLGLISTASPEITGWVRDFGGRALGPILHDPTQGLTSLWVSAEKSQLTAADLLTKKSHRSPFPPSNSTRKAEGTGPGLLDL